MGEQLTQTSLEIVKHDISSSTIVDTLCAILLLLFLIQLLGTGTKIAGCFAPVVITWLAFNLVFGTYIFVP